jgi:hypothetical protein
VEDSIQTLWNEIKALVAEVEVDLTKNITKGNSASGVRARKNLRLLKAHAAALTKLTVENDKARKLEKHSGE